MHAAAVTIPTPPSTASQRPATPRTRSAAHTAGARFCSRCPGIFPPFMDLCPDDCVSLGFCDIPHVVAGKYRIEQRIGRGGTSEVYLARDLSLGRLVALKTLRRVAPESIEMLRQEACTTAALMHPHVTVLFGVETWHETPILVFEYLEGGTLTERIAGEAIPVRSVVEWGIGLAGGLEAAHVRGILHGDVKPANVGFNAVGTPKLLDFGLASALRPHEELQRRGPAEGSPSDCVRGTAPYLSPEAITGQEAQPAFDLWGLGITLYEAVTSVNPYRQTAVDKVFQRILGEPLPDPRDFRPGCSDELARFLRSALSRRCARRPQTAREFRARLEEVRERRRYDSPAVAERVVDSFPSRTLAA
jgi:serine/threonine protein kinase